MNEQPLRSVDRNRCAGGGEMSAISDSQSHSANFDSSQSPEKTFRDKRSVRSMQTPRQQRQSHSGKTSSSGGGSGFKGHDTEIDDSQDEGGGAVDEEQEGDVAGLTQSQPMSTARHRPSVVGETPMRPGGVSLWSQTFGSSSSSAEKTPSTGSSSKSQKTYGGKKAKRRKDWF
jgi:hypothetical protein